jgi:hypothetical protein
MNAPTLAELQRGFRAAVYEGETAAAALAPCVHAGGIDPLARLRIYRHAVGAIQREALATAFPALRALVGEACFEDLADRYAAEIGSASGDLQDYGAGFAEFVAGRPELAGYPWLADVARLEWLRQQAWLAPSPPVPAADVLAQRLRQAGDDPGLRLREDVRALVADVPALDLWRFAHDPDAVAVDPAGPAQGVLLWRAQTQVAMLAVTPAQAALAAALVAAPSLRAALVVSDADPAALLRPLFDHGLVADAGDAATLGASS